MNTINANYDTLIAWTQDTKSLRADKHGSLYLCEKRGENSTLGQRIAHWFHIVMREGLFHRAPKLEKLTDLVPAALTKKFADITLNLRCDTPDACQTSLTELNTLITTATKISERYEALGDHLSTIVAAARTQCSLLEGRIASFRLQAPLPSVPAPAPVALATAAPVHSVANYSLQHSLQRTTPPSVVPWGLVDAFPSSFDITSESAVPSEVLNFQ